MSEDKLQTAIERGQRAARLFDEGLIAEVFAELEGELIKAWKTMPARDTEGRERIWQAVNLVGKVHTALGTMVANGKLARAELDALIAAESKAA